MTDKRLFAAGLFLAGCVVGGVASQVAVAPARADYTGKKWEQSCVESTNEVEDIALSVREYGKEGWELVGVTALNAGGSTSATVICMKHPAE